MDIEPMPKAALVHRFHSDAPWSPNCSHVPHHEAGHFVASCALGMPAAGAFVLPNGEGFFHSHPLQVGPDQNVMNDRSFACFRVLSDASARFLPPKQMIEHLDNTSQVVFASESNPGCNFPSRNNSVDMIAIRGETDLHQTEVSAHLLESALRVAVQICAGEQAELIHAGISLPIGKVIRRAHSSDSGLIRNVLHLVDAWETIGYVQRWARHILTSHWDEVEHIAGVLKAEGRYLAPTLTESPSEYSFPIATTPGHENAPVSSTHSHEEMCHG